MSASEHKTIGDRTILHIVDIAGTAQFDPYPPTGVQILETEKSVPGLTHPYSQLSPLNDRQLRIMRDTYLHQGRHIFADMEANPATRVQK